MSKDKLDELSKRVLAAAKDNLKKEKKAGRETYYIARIARRLARIAGFSGKKEDFEEAIKLLKEIEHDLSWRDKVMGMLAVSYARTGDYSKAQEWMDKLYFYNEKDKVRFAILNLFVQKEKPWIAEMFLNNFENPQMLIRAILAIAVKTGNERYFEKAFEEALTNKDPRFDRLAVLLDIAEALDKTAMRD